MTRLPAAERRPYDAIVLGLGAMGSATVFALARAGLRVLGLDRFAPPHALGSSHGRTRIIREAYFEHPSYVPLVRRAFDLWRDLERASPRTLYVKTRGIMIGTEEGTLVRGALASAQAYDVPHRVLAAADLRRHYPALQPGDDMVGVVEDRAGVLFPEACIAAMLELARLDGAELRVDEPAVSWEATPDGVRVGTPLGEYRAQQLVVAGGAWMRRLVPELAAMLSVVRQPIHWFEPAMNAQAFAPDRCPVTLWEYAPGHMFYALPDFGDGVKAGVHYEGQFVDPDHVDRRTLPDEDARATDLLRRFMPHAAGRLRDASVCLYTNTPDLHFIIDVHPAYPDRVVVLSACSGHGFKFASVIGEIAADLLTQGRSRFDLSLFRMGRFG